MSTQAAPFTPAHADDVTARKSVLATLRAYLRIADLQAGDLQAGDMQAGDMQAGDMQAGEVKGGHGVMPFGDARVDGCLPDGGLPLGQLHEIGCEGLAAETGAATAGFIACLLAQLLARPAAGLHSGSHTAVARTAVARVFARVFWIAPACDLHAPGLLAYGFDPGRLILVRSTDDAATLAAMETALRGGAAAAVVGEVGRFTRTPSRRLQLACMRRGTTGFVMRRWPWGRRGVDRETSAAVTRWRIGPLPSEAVAGEPGPPRWAVTLEHARGGTEGGWIMEPANPNFFQGKATDATHALRVVAELADAAADPSRRARTVDRTGTFG